MEQESQIMEQEPMSRVERNGHVFRTSGTPTLLTERGTRLPYWWNTNATDGERAHAFRLGGTPTLLLQIWAQ